MFWQTVIFYLGSNVGSSSSLKQYDISVGDGGPVNEAVRLYHRTKITQCNVCCFMPVYCSSQFAALEQQVCVNTKTRDEVINNGVREAAKHA